MAYVLIKNEGEGTKVGP